MKEIPLNGRHGVGRVAVVDDEDFERLAVYRWRAFKGTRTSTLYACTGATHRGTFQMMHWLIIGRAPEGKEVDHANRDGLDNRRENLRFATRLEQVMNRAPSSKRFRYSPYKGVRFYGRLPEHHRWEACITVNRKLITLGRFATDHEAALAYNEAAREFYGEFAYLNPVQQTVHA